MTIAPAPPLSATFAPAAGDAVAAPLGRRAFEHDVPLTIGLEEELLLLHPETFLPTPAIEAALAAVDGDGRFTCELRAAQVEIVTPVCATAADARRELDSARRHLAGRLAGAVLIAAVGTHPLAGGPVVLTERERYLRIAEHARWGCYQGYPSGLHVHVAIPGADRALAVYNALRSYLPELAALGANSPFLDGGDTGFASIRTMLNLGLGRSGIPPSFASWNDFVDFVHWGQRGGAWPDASYLWWHLRPNVAHGTLELRAADAQTRTADAAAIAALYQALAATLVRRHDAGRPLAVHDGTRIAENMFRASRDGLDATLLDLETGRAQPATDRIARLLNEVEDAADELGSGTELAAAWALLECGGASRQRAVVTRAGMDALVRWLVAETENGAAARV